MRGQAPAPAPAEVMAIDSPGGRRAEGRIRARPRQLHREPRGHPLPRGGGDEGAARALGVAGGGGEIGWASHRPSPADKLVLQNVTLHLQGRAAAGMPGLAEHHLALPSPLRPQLRLGFRSLGLHGQRGNRGRLSPLFLARFPSSAALKRKPGWGIPTAGVHPWAQSCWVGKRGVGVRPLQPPGLGAAQLPQKAGAYPGCPRQPHGALERRGGWGRRC